MYPTAAIVYAYMYSTELRFFCERLRWCGAWDREIRVARELRRRAAQSIFRNAVNFPAEWKADFLEEKSTRRWWLRSTPIRKML